MLIADISGVTIQATIDRRHGAVAGSTGDFITHDRGAWIIFLRNMMRVTDFTQVAGQAFRQFTNTRVAFNAVSSKGRSRLMVLVLLWHKVVALRTITTSGHANVALITESLLRSSRFMVLVSDIRSVALRAVTRCQIGKIRGKRSRRHSQQTEKKHHKQCFLHQFHSITFHILQTSRDSAAL